MGCAFRFTSLVLTLSATAEMVGHTSTTRPTDACPKSGYAATVPFNFGSKRIRITGVGPWSVQWEYLETNRDIARRVLADLEDRRVLFYSHGREDPEYCRRSADEIRQLMKRELSRVEQGDDMDRSLRAIRNAARAFVDQAGPDSHRFLNDMDAFWKALEDMRIAMAPYIRGMATAYAVLIDHVLDENLPPFELRRIRASE